MFSRCCCIFDKLYPNTNYDWESRCDAIAERGMASEAIIKSSCAQFSPFLFSEIFIGPLFNFFSRVFFCYEQWPEFFSSFWILFFFLLREYFCRVNVLYQDDAVVDYYFINVCCCHCHTTTTCCWYLQHLVHVLIYDFPL